MLYMSLRNLKVMNPIMPVMSESVNSVSGVAPAPSPRVCILTRKRLSYNTRVFRQAKTLTEAGYNVMIIAVAEAGLPAYEETAYYRLHRIQLTPHTFRRLKRIRAVIFRRLKRVRVVTFRRLKRIRAVIFRRSKRARVVTFRRLKRIRAVIFRRLKRVRAAIFRPLKKVRVFIFRRSKKVRVAIFRWLTLLIPEKIRERLKRPVYSILAAIGIFARTTCSGLASVLAVTALVSKFLPLPRLVRDIRGGANDVKVWWCQQTSYFSLRLRTFMINLDFFVKSLSIVRQNPAHIYHVHDSYPLLVAYVASKLHGAKLVYDAVEFGPDRVRPAGQPVSRLWGKIEAYIVRKADAVLATGESLASSIAQTYKISKPTVVMNSREYKQVYPTHTLSSQLRLDGKKIVLYMGAITKNYGLEQLVLAAPWIQNAVIVIMGPVTWKNFDSELRALVKKTGVQDRVFILKPVGREQVSSYVSSAHLGVIPIQKHYLNQVYALPNKLFDYIMARIPIAASDVHDIRQIVEMHQIGRIFDERDPKSIASVINQLLSDDIVYRRMKANLNQCAKVYCWEREATKLTQVYANLKVTA